MSWISQAMMRERTSGPYGNYGEMLYAESLEGIARRRQKVGGQGGGGGWGDKMGTMRGCAAQQR
jgi:hypothetical protein